MTAISVLDIAQHQQAMIAASPKTVTTFDGSKISGVISGLTAHTWVADSTGTYHTAADLATEWTGLYAQMLQGLGDKLSPLQRLEGNAQAVINYTGLSKLSATKQEQFREDAQREFDAIDAAMRINETKYGIDPTREFNSYTYLQMEHTLQADERLQELGYQGHGVNSPPEAKYRGFTNDFQNNTDNKTYFVGGGPGSGEKAIANFFDDDLLTHAPFAVVSHNGKLVQLNQNGDLEDVLADVLVAANNGAYEHVLVASDFSLDKTAHGEVRLVPNVKAAPPLPVAKPGQVTTIDGTVIEGTITITPHVWTADTTGLFHTAADLGKEWIAALALAQQGKALTPLQQWEANAEMVIENTGAAKLKPAKLAALREDTQREFDAVWAAMQIDAKTLGIPATAQFTTHSYLMMERTLRFNEQLEELATQGHGLNQASPTKYRGFTEDFQNHIDGKTLYVGGGPDNNEKAIAAFYDDVIITHASFPTVLHNGKLVQLNQNGTRETGIQTVVKSANDMMFKRVLKATDFKR